MAEMEGVSPSWRVMLRRFCTVFGEAQSKKKMPSLTGGRLLRFSKPLMNFV